MNVNKLSTGQHVKKSQATSQTPSISGPSEGHNKYYVNLNNSLSAQKNAFVNVKVHVNLLANIVQKRQKAKKYQVNRVIKHLAAFYLLKSLTTSGVIKDYARELPALTKYLNCVNSTFYAHLKALKRMGLVSVSEGRLNLAGYSRVGDYFDEVSTGMLTIKYDPTQDKFYQLMQAAYIATLQQRWESCFNSKIQGNPELIAFYESTLPIVKGSGAIALALRSYQVHAFIKGHPQYYAIMAYNPDFNCTARKLRQHFNFKSNKSVAYLKKMLAARGLLTIEQREYTSQVRSRLKHAYIKFNASKNQTVWKQPDALTVPGSRLVF